MDNQHKLIKGYRDLTEEEINSMNMVKNLAAQVGRLVDELKQHQGLDQRWISIGATELQQGFMALTRSIAKPESF